MKEYVNFYENMKEACMRLVNTLVLYEGLPYYVLCITNHKDDGKFRVYLDATYDERGPAVSRIPGIPYEWMCSEHDLDFAERGKKMDQFLDDNPDCGIIRKMMNSPSFNKFRPFPLGMCNYDGEALYLSRSPTRYTQQGLTEAAVKALSVEDFLFHTDRENRMNIRVPLTSYSLAQTVVGKYPSIEECWESLLDPGILNSSAAFSRDFALLRGPMRLMFLAYREDIIGCMPDRKEKKLHLSSDFNYTREAVADLGFFTSIEVND